MTTYQEFSRQFVNFRQKYRRQVDLSQEYTRYLPGDMIEIRDDMERVLPVLQQFLNCEVPPKLFWSQISQIEFRLSHMIDHLNSLKTTLEKLAEDEPTERGELQPKTTERRRKKSAKTAKKVDRKRVAAKRKSE